MAYISTEQVKSIRDQIKSAYPCYKWSIVREHYSTVEISLMESDQVFPEQYIQVNHYHYQRSERYTTKTKLMFQHILEICNSVEACYDRNAGDVGADYGDNTYFISIQVGKWDKLHKIIAATGPRHPKARVGKVLTPADVAEYRQSCEANRAQPIRSWNHGTMKISEVLVI